MANLKVLSGNGPRAAVRELCSQFARATGNMIDLRFEANPDVIEKAEAGESFDVAVGNPPTIERLIESGKVVSGSSSNIGRSGLGVAVRAGVPKPDISTVEAFTRTLLAAKAVAFPGKGASGLYFVGLLDRLVSVPKLLESVESVVIQGRWSDSRGDRQCGRMRTERNTTVII